jgi:hypothetical protein
MTFDKLAFCKRWLAELKAEQAKIESRKTMHEGIVDSDELLLEKLAVQIETCEEYIERLP